MALSTRDSTDLAQPIDPSQTLRATTALLRKIQSDQSTPKATAEKPSLLADADEDEIADDIPIWLVLTTKKHIVDLKRLKPGKILLPHTYLHSSDANLRICLITTDPQRKFKDLIADQSFPLELEKKITRVIGLKKLKAKYKSFESRRQLFSEYDVFLADDRIITHLPQVLGKVFYDRGRKRPIPINLEGKRQMFDEQGNKRRKLSEGGSKVTKAEVRPADVAREIERSLSSTLVHLAPSTTTAVKVGKSTMEPEQIHENVKAVTEGMVEKYVPQKWRNVRAVHIKGPNTVALPIYMTEELWEDEQDVLEDSDPKVQKKKDKKRNQRQLANMPAQNEETLEVIEVPGPDGKMRTVEKAAARRSEPLIATESLKKRKSEVLEDKTAYKKQRASKNKTPIGEKTRKMNGHGVLERKARGTAKAAGSV